MTKQRVSIPQKIEDEVMFKSLQKCYCGKRGDQIHHIDGDPSNNDFDNLVLLCYDHHDDASIKGGLKKRLKPRQLKQQRDQLYKNNEKKQELELQHYSKTLRRITEENLYRAALDAAITLEIIKIRSDFFDERDWNKRYDILRQLRKYADYSSFRVSYEAIQLLSEIADDTRNGMSANMASTIWGLILDYWRDLKTKKQTIEIADICINIAFAISYDALIKLGNLAVAEYGLLIFKDVYHRGKRGKLQAIADNVLKQYSELEHTLKRPERDDLGNAQRLVESFKNDIDTPGLRTPDNLPNDLVLLTLKHVEKADQRIR